MARKHFFTRIFCNEFRSLADEDKEAPGVFIGHLRLGKTLWACENVKKSHRKFVVFASLVGVLTVTSALLLALAPAPLVPDAYSSLFAIDAPRSMDAIFETK